MNNIASLRSMTTYTVLVKKNGFSGGDSDMIRAFCDRYKFDLVHLPHLKEDEVNVHNVFPKPIYHGYTKQLMDSGSRFNSEYAFDVGPVFDDNPYFGNYFRWSKFRQIYSGLGGRWEAFLEGGFVVNLIFILSLLFSMVVLGPFFVRRKRIVTGNLNPLFFYFLIGLAYMFTEVVLVQRFILFLGQPIYSVSLVVSTLLVSSGLGSMMSQRFGVSRLKTILSLLSMMVLAYIPLLNLLFELFLQHGLVARLLSSVVVIFPLGFLMGLPFPLGLKFVDKDAVSLVWAANGCASVIGAVLVILVALSAGFAFTQLVAAFLYVLCVTIVWRFGVRRSWGRNAH